MSARWYKRCGADFIHGTMSLSLEEKGAYSLCLDLIYDRGGPIPDDARWLSGVCGVSIRKWNALRERLIEAGKIYVALGLLSVPAFDVGLLEPEGRIAGEAWAAIRAIVFARDGHQCTYCSTSTGPFECDHVHPISRGGSNEMGNLTTACVQCNRSKGDKLLAEWIR